MANIIDYLRWRGDLDFSTSPFNEIDAAIFSMVSYVNLSGVVPECGWDSWVSMKAASEQILWNSFPSGEKDKPSPGNLPTLNNKFNSDLEELFRALSVSPRFENVWLSGFEKNTDYVAIRQFAAVTYKLPVLYPVYVVAFRGTDGTVVGWKEDFGLAYLEQIPAQEYAHKYLEQALAQLTGQFAVCGHSKGGNLAVYAGSHIGSPYPERISWIYNFDGPGFNFSLTDKTQFNLYQNKVINYVPEESMVGMIFDSVGERRVVSSLARSAYQHNAFYWNVERTRFARGDLSNIAKMFNCILKSWISDVSVAERKAFLEAVFDLLGDGDEAVLTTDPRKNLAEVIKTLRKYKHLDRETKLLINLVFGSLSTQTKRTLSTTIQQKLPKGKPATS